MSDERMKDPGSERFTSAVIKALGLHLLLVALLFVSFSSAPEFEPAQPIVQATLVQLNSESPATTQTDQQIAGEAERTAAQRHEAEELEREQQEQQEEQEAAQAAAEQQRQAEAASAARAAEEQKAAEERQQAEQVERQKAEEARRADAARKLAEEEAAKKKAAEEAAQRKAAEEAKRKADAAAKAEADRIARLKREQEEARASALADLLAEETQYQQAQADQMGEQVAASYDDVIRRYVSEQWRRPPTARNGMLVEVRISMLPSGDITDAVVVRSSGDAGFDQAAVQAVRNVGRIPEMQQLSRDDPATFDRMYRQRTLRFKPEDLDF